MTYYTPLHFPRRDEGKEPIPRWVCAVVFVLHVVYYNFDNMDGKQARRTGTSSALGMLIDH